jgi:hypothetical protein
LLLASAFSAFAGETVYLNSGFFLVADSHTQSDGTYVFRIGAGTVEVAERDVREIVSSPDAVQLRPATVNTLPLDLKPQSLLTSAAMNEGIDALFVKAVAKVESGMRQDAISQKGAVGLMQLMPDTAANLGVNATNADENASGGARYLRSLLERYHYDPVLTLAAYNAGPGAVKKYRGVPPYYETRTYVVRVLKEYERQLKAAATNTARPTLGSTPKTTIATN